MPRSSVITSFVSHNNDIGPDGTINYVELTVSSSQVTGSNLTNFPVYVDLSDMPSEFFTNVQNDGGDIRITKNDGVTRLATEIVSIDTSASIGELHFLADTLSSASDTKFRIYCNANETLSQPAADETYGRNAVWANYTGVWHLEEDPSGTAPQMIDSTGGYFLTSSGSMLSNDSVNAQLGLGIDFDGSNDFLQASASIGNEDFSKFFYSTWVNSSDSSSVIELMGTVNDGSSVTVSITLNRDLDLTAFADGYVQVYIRDSAADQLNAGVKSNTGITDGTWNHFACNIDTSNNLLEVYINGSSQTISYRTQQTPSSFLGFDYPLFFGARNARGTADRFYVGQLDEKRLLTGNNLSADWISAEYVNQNAPSTFYSVGRLRTI